MTLKSFISALFIFLFSISVSAQVKDTIPWTGSEFIKHGISLFDKGDYKASLEFYNRVNKCDPDYPMACYEAALSYENLGEYESGLKKVNIADSLSPDLVHNIILKGSLLDELSRRKEAIEFLENGRKKWPYNHLLLYNLAIVYVNESQYEVAEKILTECVKLSPYHSGTHFLLGTLNYRMGRIAESILACNMGLIMNPSVNNVTKFENIVTGSSDPKPLTYLYPYPEGYDATQWKELTKLCNSGLAFRSEFPYKIKPNFYINRQSQLLFQKMEFNPKDTTIYNQFYVRFFKNIYDKKDADVLYGYQLQNINNDEVDKLNKANKARTNKFAEYAQNAINLWREYEFSADNENRKVKTRLFEDNGKTYLIGTQYMEKEPDLEGNYIRLNTDGAIVEKGTYKNNEISGSCTILRLNGSVSQDLNFTEGELDSINKTYYKNGNLAGIYPRDKGKQNGCEIQYSLAGRVIRNQCFVDDKAEGMDSHLYLSSGWTLEQNYKNGKPEGIYTEKWFNGKLKETGNYTDSLLNGIQKKWYANGNPESEINFKNDYRSGDYTLYHTNGVIKEKGTYNDSALFQGIVTNYDRSGKIVAQISYENGKLDGPMTYFYPNGNKETEFFNSKDVLTKEVSYDLKGNIIYQAEAQNGVLPVKVFYNDGSLKHEGNIINGKHDGEWRYYTAGGILSSIENWKEEMESGVQQTFYPAGFLKSEYYCDSNKIDGPYKEYFQDGKIKLISYYRKGLLQGEYKTYYNSGQLMGEYYFKDNIQTGRAYEYSPEGKLSADIEYDEEGEIKIINYYINGKLDLTIPYDKDSITIQSFYPNGKIKYRATLVDGLKDGVSESFYPNGKIQSSQVNIHGKINGLSKYWDIEGRQESVYPYIMDKIEGKAYNYDNGKLENTNYYEEGKEQGIYRDYYPNGKIFRMIPYADDEREGDYEFFSPDSILLFAINYQSGIICSIKIRNKQGVLENIAANYSGDNELTSYYPNGAVAAIIPFTKGYMDGTLTLFRVNGNKICEWKFKDDFYEGARDKYYENGKLYESISYSNNDMNGEYIKYYESGIKMEEGEYANDNKTGTWSYYDATGKLKYKVLYKNGNVLEIQ